MFNHVEDQIIDSCIKRPKGVDKIKKEMKSECGNPCRKSNEGKRKRIGIKYV